MRMAKLKKLKKDFTKSFRKVKTHGKTGIVETRRIHQMWKEVRSMSPSIRKRLKILKASAANKYQYLFRSPKGMISMITLPSYSFRFPASHPRDCKEIMCMKGNFFSDVYRFDTEKEARMVIWKYLSMLSNSNKRGNENTE